MNQIKFVWNKFSIFFKDCDIRLWHIENCDEIKQVIEQNKKSKKLKTADVRISSFVFLIEIFE
jgi:hypothetical protein